jgi:hypothetical protein
MQVRLYINPTHAMTQDVLFWSGKWNSMEQWQRTLAAQVASARKSGCDVKLFDFSGYNSVTTEAIPQVTQRKDMLYYWEPSHYRANVGRMVIQRMFGGTGDEAPSDFGVELTPSIMEQHLGSVRQARDRYHDQHPVESQISRQLAQAHIQVRD